MSDHDVQKNEPPPAEITLAGTGRESPDVTAVAFSNAIRLSGKQWIGVVIFALLLGIFAPSLWKQVEKLPDEPDYRLPHVLGNDYWFYERYAQQAAQKYETLVIGDSVVWGVYVKRDHTLSHYLNELSHHEDYANLGLEGAHPLALAGLIEHYGGAVVGKKVVLQCNPLWMSFLAADLQDPKKPVENHPQLIPQFVPSIPAYHAEISPRIGVVVEQHWPMSSWTTHLQQAYYTQTDIPGWTLEHPYENPLQPLTRGLPSPDEPLQYEPIPWDDRKHGKRSDLEKDFAWIDMETSLQWRAFRGLVKLLQQRGNRVFVVVGPFNEHLLKPDSRQRYQQVKATIAAWLKAEQVLHVVPPPLASEQYGDSSHPLAAGYAELARQLLEEPFFKDEGLGR